MSRKGLIRALPVSLALAVLALVAIALFTSQREAPARSAEAAGQDRLLFFRAGHGADGVLSINIDGTNERQLFTEAEVGSEGIDVNQIKASPDGRLIAYATAGYGPNWDTATKNGLWVMLADGTNKRRLAQGTADSYVANPTWSPDSKQIAYARRYMPFERGAELHIVNADGTGDRVVTQDQRFVPFRAFDMWWHRDGEILWLKPGRDSSHYINLTTGELAPVAPGVPWYGISFSPDGRRAAITDQVRPDQVKKAGITVENMGPRAGLPYWSPSGQAAAFNAPAEGTIFGLWYWDIASGRRLLLLESRDGPHTAIGVAPDNHHVLYWTRDGFEAINVETKQRRLVVPAPSGKSIVAFVDWLKAGE